MTPEQFVYWLQGLMELGNPKSLTAEQTTMIKDHLGKVFNREPTISEPYSWNTVPANLDSIPLSDTKPLFPHMQLAAKEYS
jgi:hypothetical protein